MNKFGFAFLLLINLQATSQKINSNNSLWRAAIHRPDGNDIVFNFKVEDVNRKKNLFIINGSEKIKVDNVSFTKDSVFIGMPVFESSFKAKTGNTKWEGEWTKGTSGKDQILPFTAERNNYRFKLTQGNAKFNISGRWEVTFESDKTKADASIAEFKQTGNKITGTFLTPSGDYRYQEGIVTGNKLMLSGFDGAHAYLFTADIISDKTITNGIFYSGAKNKEGWTAVKDANAKVSTEDVAMYLKPNEEKLNFHFTDINGKEVGIDDARFKNKVVIVQILGSWCPNCMDETAFLSNYYNKNKQRGIEVIGLAYEYSTDFNRSVKSLRKFQQRFQVQYPLLITGVSVSDTLRTEKTLPQVTPIKVFPSSIIIDKKGKVRKFDTGFFGPGTGMHYEEYKKEFYTTINELLKEK
ncbi:MAG: TlpA family protein disulfide reductase [Bacteroidota bacterium]|nr:TlpA family protein disulfide reductase [Bacteroidota bacterium]